jgi:single-strand DNA-binding protein
MLNRVQIIGRLGADPEVRQLASGSSVVNFRLAVSEQWRDKNSGERKERTEWIPCVCWNEGLARVLESYVRKGSLVYVEGAFQTRKWQDKDGNDRYTTEVVMNANAVLRMLDSKRDDAQPSAPTGTGYTGRSAPQPASAGGGKIIDDEIPFSPCWQ